MDLATISRELANDVETLKFGAPVAHVYNPLRYAREPYERYLYKYARRSVETVLLGMNPGPFGMAQTGVPFGEVSIVRDWLDIDGPVDRPAQEHPKRPILGFECQRSEVSGKRLWGWAKDRFGSPERFFQRFFLANYCPLVFLEESGRNLTPDKLPVDQRKPLFEVCDRALCRTVEYFRPQYVVGVGVFAENRAREALSGFDLTVGRILHPSPANPQANQGWAEQVDDALAELGLRFSAVEGAALGSGLRIEPIDEARQ